eukprot:704753-Pyramimonas_sp.AAC.1
MAWVPNLEPIVWQKRLSPYFDDDNIDDIWPWLQQKGVRLTKIHPLHRDEASKEFAKPVEDNKEEKNKSKRTAEANQAEPAAKPSGT